MFDLPHAPETELSMVDRFHLVFSHAGDERPSEDEGEGLALQDAEPDFAPPPMYRVVLLNDDYTPMDFVVEVLEKFFAMDREAATRVMLAVHNQGRAVCGIYTRDIAETRAMQVNQYARECQHPLLCEAEKDV